MSRLQADLALAFAGLIWGVGFLAQKTALDHTGPFTFVAARFLISALFVLPLVLRERGLSQMRRAINPKNAKRLALLCGFFALAVLLQQSGLKTASVTHAAFLTSLYIVMVPFMGRLFHRNPLTLLVFAGSFLSIVGIWLLSGAHTQDLAIALSRGDGLILLCSFGFATQVVVMGRLAKKMQLPFTLSFLQYIVVGLIALVLAALCEDIHLSAILMAWKPILFAGIASGGIAYTLQFVAQQHTPAADAAIIMSSEALFGGLCGMLIMHDPVSTAGILGCCTIIAAIILVELGPFLQRKRLRRVS